jgi:hypothetical protein
VYSLLDLRTPDTLRAGARPHPAPAPPTALLPDYQTRTTNHA